MIQSDGRYYYSLSRKLTINGHVFKKAIIDSHVYNKHGEHVVWETIQLLISQLEDQYWIAEARDDDYQYFVSYLILTPYRYRLVWLTQTNKDFIGVITCFRDRRATNEFAE